MGFFLLRLQGVERTVLYLKNVLGFTIFVNMLNLKIYEKYSHYTIIFFN